MVLISEFLYLIRKGPKTVMVVGPETWSAVTWCRYCVIQSKREGEEGVGAVLFRSRVAHMLLVWGALYGAKNHMEKARGTTFVPFYSAKKENVSKKRSKVV